MRQPISGSQRHLREKNIYLICQICSVQIFVNQRNQWLHKSHQQKQNPSQVGQRAIKQFYEIKSIARKESIQFGFFLQF